MNTDLTLLHPTMRSGVVNLNEKLVDAKIPLRLYEGWRGPDRQAELFMQTRAPGRGTMGPPHVTFSKPWIGRHQYGLAGDWVFWVNNHWTWVEPESGMWDAFDKLAESVGLESIKFERPHVQLAGLKLSDLLAGKYPDGGDASWQNNLSASIQAWGPDARAVYVGGVAFTWLGAPPPPVLHIEHLDAPGRAWDVPVGMYYDEEKGMCLMQSAPDQTLVPQG